MIISKTPFRISFFGGGTDYPVWFKENKGAVLATSIDKYCYINLRYLPPFFDYKHRIVYSKVEHVKKISEIDHPAVRGVLSYMKIKQGIEIHHDGDLPARAGLGTSSSFTVGLLNALYALNGKIIPKKDLATETMHVEQNILKENVGSQDQIIAAFGGFNKIEFNGDDDFRIQPVIINKEKYNNLQDHMMLFFTGFSRIASNIAKEQIKKTPDRKKELNTMFEMVNRAVDILCGSDSDFLVIFFVLGVFFSPKPSP